LLLAIDILQFVIGVKSPKKPENGFLTLTASKPERVRRPVTLDQRALAAPVDGASKLLTSGGTMTGEMLVSFDWRRLGR
jgi:hypothetical protein